MTVALRLCSRRAWSSAKVPRPGPASRFSPDGVCCCRARPAASPPCLDAWIGGDKAWRLICGVACGTLGCRVIPPADLPDCGIPRPPGIWLGIWARASRGAPRGETRRRPAPLRGGAANRGPAILGARNAGAAIRGAAICGAIRGAAICGATRGAAIGARSAGAAMRGMAAAPPGIPRPR
jgi:hypothetical protein